MRRAQWISSVADDEHFLLGDVPVLLDAATVLVHHSYGSRSGYHDAGQIRRVHQSLVLDADCHGDHLLLACYERRRGTATAEAVQHGVCMGLTFYNLLSVPTLTKERTFKERIIFKIDLRGAYFDKEAQLHVSDRESTSEDEAWVGQGDSVEKCLENWFSST